MTRLARWRQTCDPAVEPLKGQTQLRATRAGSAEAFQDNLGADLQQYRRSPHDEAEDISVSLIIATRDRCESLSRCLQSVKQITFERPWEIILVDNGSIDDTAGVVREFISASSFPAVYLLEIQTG